ncbi:MAG: zinc dependent phospholipase C family protein [Aggregatilineales bacterium]
MPTPFTHLEIAQRLLRDEDIPEVYLRLLNAERPAFLLGNIAADARVGNGAPRETTHFYLYGQDIQGRVWRKMVAENPRLLTPNSPAHRAFIAGYVAHLTVDETWSIRMVMPHFVEREWADRMQRFYMLHMILIAMDERDLPRIESWQPDTLNAATPENWLDFIPDDDLQAWKSLIYEQIKPDGIVKTLDIFGARVAKPPEELRALLDSDEAMQANLWDHISKPTLNAVEQACYNEAHDQLMVYLRETEPANHQGKG